jgi:hypothetical protein
MFGMEPLDQFTLDLGWRYMHQPGDLPVLILRVLTHPLLCPLSPTRMKILSQTVA